MQPDLFEPAKLPASLRPDGRGMRDTSRAAFSEQRAAGKVKGAQARITAFLEARRGQSFTRSEISRGTGMPINVVAGRVNELIHVKQMLVEKGKRVCSVSGKTVYAVGLR